ncbi:MAG: DUF4382 domain-containing protein [Chitinivibrionales bacterium]|nr:DUF4382 domain-containing protein [Chitinivibrionales bacterium]
MFVLRRAQMNVFHISAFVLLMLTQLFTTGCSEAQQKAQALAKGQGAMLFTANGEDFVRKGFADKSGWHIVFDTLLVNIVNPIAYMPGCSVHVCTLSGSHVVDLARGDEYAAPAPVAVKNSLEAGNYQSLKFNLRRVASGPFAGSSIIMIGTAAKGEKKVPFTIKLDEEIDFDGKEGYVGDEIMGMVNAGDTATVEMTFHFDHIFGDNEAPADDHITTESVGFDFFYAHTENDTVKLSQADLRETEDYSKLVKAIWTLGHLGEGHCEATNQSSKDVINAL